MYFPNGHRTIRRRFRPPVGGIVPVCRANIEAPSTVSRNTPRARRVRGATSQAGARSFAFSIAHTKQQRYSRTCGAHSDRVAVNSAERWCARDLTPLVDADEEHRAGSGGRHDSLLAWQPTTANRGSNACKQRRSRDDHWMGRRIFCPTDALRRPRPAQLQPQRRPAPAISLRPGDNPVSQRLEPHQSGSNDRLEPATPKPSL